MMTGDKTVPGKEIGIDDFDALVCEVAGESAGHIMGLFEEWALNVKDDDAPEEEDTDADFFDIADGWYEDMKDLMYSSCYLVARRLGFPLSDAEDDIKIDVPEKVGGDIGKGIDVTTFNQSMEPIIAAVNGKVIEYAKGMVGLKVAGSRQKREIHDVLQAVARMTGRELGFKLEMNDIEKHVIERDESTRSSQQRLF